MTLVRIDVIEGRRNPVQLEILAVTVHAMLDTRCPPKPVTELAAWLYGYAGNECEPRIRSLLEAYTTWPGSV
jgi:hypothetical protein